MVVLALTAAEPPVHKIAMKIAAVAAYMIAVPTAIINAKDLVSLHVMIHASLHVLELVRVAVLILVVGIALPLVQLHVVITAQIHALISAIVSAFGHVLMTVVELVRIHAQLHVILYV